MPVVNRNIPSNLPPRTINPSEVGPNSSSNNANTTPDSFSSLPRSRVSDEPISTEPTSFFGRIANFFRNNERATAAVMLGATVAPMLVGVAANANAAPINVSVDSVTAEAEAKWQDFQTKVSELEAKAGDMSYSDLVEARQKLYQEYVQNGGSVGLNVDADSDGLDLAKELLFGTSDTKIDSDGDKMSDGYELSKGFNPADSQNKAVADVEGWTHGYIPMSNNPMIEKDGMLMYDLLIKDRTGTDPKLRHIEGRSAMDKGHYFLSSTLDEANAELTAAKDFNGDGVLTPGVKHDFLRPSGGEATWGRDNKTETTLSVGWWGHCNDVATAGINFHEPTKMVEYELSQPFTRYTVETNHGTFHAEKVEKGDTHTDIHLLSGQTVRLKNDDVHDSTEKVISKIVFTPSQVKELLSELVHRGSNQGTDWTGSRFGGRDANIRLKDGTTLRGTVSSDVHSSADDVSGTKNVTARNFTSDISARVYNRDTKSYENRVIEADKIESIRMENKRDVAPIKFHETMMKWIGSERKAGVMDKDSGPHVWNYSFDRYEFDATERENDSNTVDFEMKVRFSGGSMTTTYNYSITYENGVPKTGEWDKNSPNPDFFWRDRGGPEAFNHTNTSGATPIDFDVTMEIYNKSFVAQ